MTQGKQNGKEEKRKQQQNRMSETKIKKRKPKMKETNKNNSLFFHINEHKI